MENKTICPFISSSGLNECIQRCMFYDDRLRSDKKCLIWLATLQVASQKQEQK